MTLLRRPLSLLLLLSILAALPAWAAKEAGPLNRRATSSAEADGVARVIVKYRAESALMRPLAATQAIVAPRHAAVMAARLGLPLQDRHVLGARTQSLQSRGVTSDELARRLAAQPDVEWAEPVRRKTINAVEPNDPYYGPNQPTAAAPAVGQWYLRAPDATAVAAINAVGAWSTTLGVPTVTVAVLDTGVRFDHPDLVGKLYPGYDFISGDSDGTFKTAADGDGRDADATDPGDWAAANECESGSARENSSWHGTETAGLIGAATDNSIGMASVGRNIMVLPVRVLGKCGGYDDDIIAAMRWAAGLSATPVANAHPAKVINMSLGSTGACTAAGNGRKYLDVFAELVANGVTVVVAAGNDEGLAVSLPANCPGAIAVAGLRHIGTKVGYSNVGPEVTIAAPAGNCVNTTGPCLYPLLTTTNAGTTTPSSDTYSNSTNYSVGTSFAAPLVAGTVALMLSVDPTLTPAVVRDRLRSTARAFPTTGAESTVAACHAPNGSAQDECYCTTSTCGAGMLNAAAAVAAVTPAVIPPPTAVLTASTTFPTVGASVTLGAATSAAYGGRTIAAYQWQISSGASLAAFSGPTNAATATLVANAAGEVVVQLTVTDSAGVSGTQTVTLNTQPPPAPPGDSGGGGAMSAGWLGLLSLAIAFLGTRRRFFSAA